MYIVHNHLNDYLLENLIVDYKLLRPNILIKNSDRLTHYEPAQT